MCYNIEPLRLSVFMNKGTTYLLIYWLIYLLTYLRIDDGMRVVWLSTANRPSPADAQMLNVARHQFQSRHQHHQHQLDAIEATRVDDVSLPASPSASTSTPPHSLPPLDGVSRSTDSPPPPTAAPAVAAEADDRCPWPAVSAAAAVPLMAHRRRAVDASDLRQCALVQTRMKAWKSAGYVPF